MSNHKLTQTKQYAQVGLTDYPCYFTVDGASAVTAGSTRGPFYTVTYNASGVYDVVLNDVYYKFIGFTGGIIGNADLELKLVAEPTVGATTTTFQVVTQSGGTSGAVTSKTIFFNLTVISTIAGFSV